MDISTADQRLVADPAESGEMKFFDPRQKPFRIYGLKEGLIRVPADRVKSCNENLRVMANCTSGGRISFATDSERIVVRAEVDEAYFSHMPSTCASGFDLYGDGTYLGTFIPPAVPKGIYEAALDLPKKFRNVLMHFPLYNRIHSLEIGLLPGSALESSEPYQNPGRIVFYGSSITQGACASRPGNCYPAILSRRLGTDFFNLGFSGGAKAEPEITEYIAEQEMSALVLDYDHNADDADYLLRTHEPLFLRIRERNPVLPVLFVTKPDFEFDPNGGKRREIVRRTYLRALERGDKFVWFADGEKLFGSEGRDGCTVDRCHPNDLGFYRMAEGLYPYLAQMLGLCNE